MKFSLAQILLLTSSSAHTLLQDNDIEADLTEDLRIQMSKWDARKLDRFFGEAIEDAEDDWRDAMRDYVRWKRRHHDGKSKEELDELRRTADVKPAMTKAEWEARMKAGEMMKKMDHGPQRYHHDKYGKYGDRDYVSRDQA